MSAGGDSALRAAFTEVAKAEKAGDFDRALKAANRALKQRPDDETAFRCKVAALVQLSRFEDALQLIRKTPPTLTKQCYFERAYCEYRLNRTDEAMKTLESLKSEQKEEPRCLELLAQLHYRLESWSECAALYTKLVRHTSDEFDSERAANLLAVRAAQALSGHQDPSMDAICAETYEQHYNRACALAAGGHLHEALEELASARKLCAETLLEDGASEEEIQDEQAVIDAQMAYCHQMLKENGKALEIYLDVLKLRPSDVSVSAVANNNIVSIKQEANLFDARKKLKACTASTVEQKLSALQRRVVAFNNALLQLHSNQLEPCRRALAELRRQGASADAALVESALCLRQKDHKRAAQVLSESLAERPNDDGLRLALANVHWLSGDFAECGAMLEAAASDGHLSPAMVGVLVWMARGRAGVKSQSSKTEVSSRAAAIFDAAMQQCGERHLETLLEQCALMHMRDGQHAKASAYLEKLRQLRPDSASVVARLMQIYSEFDSERAEQLSQQLPALGSQLDQMDTGALDVDKLESSEAILMGERYWMRKEAKHAPNTPGQAPKKRKRKRKLRLPKDYDPNVKPDPERWLPKYERSTFKKRKDKRHRDRDVGRGTQGAAAGAALTNQLDSSTKPTGPAQAAGNLPASPKVPQAPGPRQQRPGGQRKANVKKKKHF